MKKNGFLSVIQVQLIGLKIENHYSRIKKLKNYNNLSIDAVNYPNPNDWTSWRRSPLSHGFTPLTQINKKNISNLKLSWSLTMSEGSNQGTPLVYDGVMFLTHPDNIIQAINAKKQVDLGI